MIQRWTIQELAAAYGYDLRFVRRIVKKMISSGRYPHAVIPWGKSYRVDPEAFDRALCEEVRKNAG